MFKHPLVSALLPIVFTLLAGGCCTAPNSSANAGAPSATTTPRVISAQNIPATEVITSKSLAEEPLNARDIIREAHLDDRLRSLFAETAKGLGQADGRLSLGDYVTALNGSEVVEFVAKNGYVSFAGPVEIRKWPSHMEIDVTVLGKNGRKMTLILQSDGRLAGRG